MEFHFTTKLEEYYQKFVELQEKLRKRYVNFCSMFVLFWLT